MIRLTAPVVLPCDPACSVLRDGVVDVGDDGRITFVGARAQAPASDDPVHALHGVLLPGLINTHAHTPMLALRGAGGDLRSCAGCTRSCGPWRPASPATTCAPR